MALEVLGSEEKGDENKKVVGEVKGSEMDKAMFEVVQDLQKQIEELKKSKAPATQTQSDQGDALRQLADILQNNRTGNSNSFSFQETYAAESQIDPEDVLEVQDWVSFVSHFTSYIIVDDTRNGRPVRAPFKPIAFVYDSHVITAGQNDEQNIFNTCTYVCKSKKELEWLRGHSNFGLYFFDSIKAARSITGEKAAKLAVIMGALNKLGQHELISMARLSDIHVDSSTDIGTLRGQIALHRIEEMSQSEKNVSNKMISESAFEAEMVGMKMQGMVKNS